MKQNFFQLVLSILGVFFFSISGFSQPPTDNFTVYARADGSYRAEDILQLDSGRVLLMGSAHYSSFPCEGVMTDPIPSWGNVFLLLDQDGQILDSVRIVNVYPVGFQSYIPAHKMYRIASGEVAVPFFDASAV